jgi:predicted aspartyl protease
MFMGITTIDARVFNPADRSRIAELQFTVDSGANYSLVPATVLEELGIQPDTTKRFFLANGDAIERKMGNAGFEYLGEVAHARIIFGEEGDAALMGITTLEAFGFVLDPFKRELRPMPMRL